MFSVTEFIMKTIKGMVGNYPDFQIREYSANWYAKGKLTEENLAEIDTLIEAQYIIPETSDAEDTEAPADEPEETTGEDVEEPEEPEESSGETPEEPDGESPETTE